MCSMFRSVLAGTYTGVVVGIGTSIIASSFYGTAALPFIIGSSVGFALGSLRWYEMATKEALLDLQRYPTLMRLHLISNFPWKPELGEYDVLWYTAERFGSSWVMRSMLLSSWLSAQPAIEEIRARSIANLVEKYSQSQQDDSTK